MPRCLGHCRSRPVAEKKETGETSHIVIPCRFVTSRAIHLHFEAHGITALMGCVPGVRVVFVHLQNDAVRDEHHHLHNAQ